jgi:hypothetical protein
MHEQTASESLDTIYANQGWPELPSCGDIPKFVNIESLVPTTSSAATYIAQVRQLPEHTTGVDSFALRVSANLGNPNCPPP